MLSSSSINNLHALSKINQAPNARGQHGLRRSYSTAHVQQRLHQSHRSGYGALAGVMSTMMMAGSVGEQEYLVKLAQLKVCSTPSGLPSPPLRARLTRNLWHVLRRG